MNLFKKKTEPELDQPSDVQIIRGKLAAVEQEVAEAETNLQRVSIEAALSGDTTAGLDAVSHLSELRARRELLVAALKQAEQAERDNLGKVNAREFEARKRSLSQHLGRLQRDAADVVAALISLRDAYHSLVESGQSVVRVLPGQMLTSDNLTDWAARFGQKQFRHNVELEAWRIAGDQPFPACPPTRPLYSHELPSLEEIIRDLGANLQTSLNAVGPAPIPKAVEPEPLPYIERTGEREEMTANV